MDILLIVLVSFFLGRISNMERKHKFHEIYRAVLAKHLGIRIDNIARVVKATLEVI